MAALEILPFGQKTPYCLSAYIKTLVYANMHGKKEMVPYNEKA